MPTVKDLEYNKFKKNSDGDYVRTQNNNSIVITENSNHSIDAFGRLRISQSLDLFDSKLISSANTDQFNEVTVGAGSISYSYQTASVNLSISQANNDRSLRESRYLYYVPGKGQKIVMTGVLAENSTDDIYVVTRSSVSGSVVNTKIHKDSWIDSLDGTGGSGETIDFTKAGIFGIDFQWLGVGKVRFAIVSSSGPEILIYEDKNSFINDNVYMRTASLPIRYEIVSDGSYIYRRIGYFNDDDGVFFESRTVATTGTYNLKEICCSVSSDGGVKPVAIVYHANTRGQQATANNAGVNILAVKLVNSYKTNENRKTANLLSNIFFANDQNTIFEVFKVTNWTDNGSSWTAANSESACEYAAGSNINITVIASHMIACSVVAANASGSKADSGAIGTDAPFDLIDENRIIKQNYDSTQSELFLIKAYTIDTGATTDVGSAMTWLESE
jgi:hypothetical protein